MADRLVGVTEYRLLPCDRCGRAASARERGNGHANWCDRCTDALADLGARVVDIANEPATWLERSNVSSASADWSGARTSERLRPSWRSEPDYSARVAAWAEGYAQEVSP